jgi:cation transport ATPase
MAAISRDILFRRALITIAIAGLVAGLAAAAAGRHDQAQWLWTVGTLPVVIGLLISMIRDLLAGRIGVDAIAFVSMCGALVLGQSLAGIVIAVMYAGGNVLEDFAVTRAERDLRSLVDRAPRLAIARRSRGSKTCQSVRSRLATGSWCGEAN